MAHNNKKTTDEQAIELMKSDDPKALAKEKGYNLKSKALRKSVVEQMMVAGMDTNYLAQKMKKHMEAKQGIYVSGEKIDEVDDFKVQQGAMKMYMDMAGLKYSDTKEEAKPQNAIINILYKPVTEGKDNISEIVDIN